MTALAEQRTPIALDGEALALSEEELDRLLASLAGLEEAAAASVAEQIAALRLAGGTIGLFPTEAELAALRLALAALGITGESADGDPGAALSRA